MRSVVYAVASSVLLAATSAQAAVTMSFTGDTSSNVTEKSQSQDLPDGGVLAVNVKAPPVPTVSYGGSTTTDVEILQNNSASFTSGVAARGPGATYYAPGASATSTTGITALVTNTGAGPVVLNSIGSTIIQAGMGFIVQNPHDTPQSDDPFTGHGVNAAGGFGDFDRGGIANGATIATASFSFTVSSSQVDGPLYTLNGSVSLGFDAHGNVVETSNVADAKSVLNGFSSIYPLTLPLDNHDKVAGYEWNETPINVPLGVLLGGRDSSFNSLDLYYEATATVDISAPCVLASNGSTECITAYSGFGDPVGRGGGVLDTAMSFAGLLGSFNSFQNTPNSGTNPDTISQIIFDPQTITPFTLNVGGVPEPATWATMILGFGLAGATLRRRRMVSYS